MPLKRGRWALHFQFGVTLVEVNKLEMSSTNLSTFPFKYPRSIIIGSSGIPYPVTSLMASIIDDQTCRSCEQFLPKWK